MSEEIDPDIGEVEEFLNSSVGDEEVEDIRDLEWDVSDGELEYLDEGDEAEYAVGTHFVVRLDHGEEDREGDEIGGRPEAEDLVDDALDFFPVLGDLLLADEFQFLGEEIFEDVNFDVFDFFEDLVCEVDSLVLHPEEI